MDFPIDSRIPWRIGCPILPVLPVDTTYIPSSTEVVKNLRTVLDILLKHNIPVESDTSPMTALRKPRSNPKNEVPTVLIWATYTPNCETTWIEAVKEIGQFFLTQDNMGYAVEIIDPSFARNRIQSSAILSEHKDILKVWNDRYLQIYDAIRLQRWATMDMFLWKYPWDPDHAKPTVLICAQDADNDIWWTDILPEVRRRLKNDLVEMDVFLLSHSSILCASSPLDIAEEYYDRLSAEEESEKIPEENADFEIKEMSELIREDAFYTVINIGTSCGPFIGSMDTLQGTTMALHDLQESKEYKTGTLGGRIVLKPEDEPELELGMSNFHVLEQAFQGSTSGNGSFPPQKYKGITISPSLRDYVAEQRRLLLQIQSRRKKCHDASTYSLATGKDRATLIEESWMDMNMAKNLLNRVKKATLRVGHVYAASGNRTVVKKRPDNDKMVHWPLDWALTRVDSLREISNLISWDGKKGQGLSTYCSIEPSTHYLVKKRGRTTAWSKGIMSAASSLVNEVQLKVPELKSPLVIDTIKDQFDGKPVLCHSIVKDGSSFLLEPGDSGSFILLDEENENGTIVGLGFAANSSTGASYMIPADFLFEDIEAVTGAKVVEPTKVDAPLVTRNKFPDSLLGGSTSTRKI